MEPTTVLSDGTIVMPEETITSSPPAQEQETVFSPREYQPPSIGPKLQYSLDPRADPRAPAGISPYRGMYDSSNLLGLSMAPSLLPTSAGLPSFDELYCPNGSLLPRPRGISPALLPSWCTDPPATESLELKDPLKSGMQIPWKAYKGEPANVAVPLGSTQVGNIHLKDLDLDLGGHWWKSDLENPSPAPWEPKLDGGAIQDGYRGSIGISGSWDYNPGKK